jgi:ligand-binding sensor domain-containing protein
MRKYIQLSAVLLVLAFTASCIGQKQTDQQKDINTSSAASDTDAQIAEYIVEAFEDSKGHLWFGTMAYGAARYDGKALTYFTTKDGLPGNTVASIIEDKEGNLWFGTHSGLSKYDGNTFANFTITNGLCHDRVSNILIDSKGQMWIGTWGGVCVFDGSTFSGFPLPVPEVTTPLNPDTQNWITEIMEDHEGNIWIGRDGYGAYKYDGALFTHFTKKDGLPSNNVQSIMEDRRGNIWFTTRVAERDNPDPANRTGGGGLSRYDPKSVGKSFTHFEDIEGLSENDIYTIYEDTSGDIWIGAIGIGVYRYDGSSFIRYKETNRMDLTHGLGLQSILEDRNSRFWLGFSGGLFRLVDSTIINVTRGGPWD